MFSLVLTDFVSHLLNFALYFFYLLFNCQVSIAPAFYVSLSIISPLPLFVKRFFKTFLSFFEVTFFAVFCDSFTILSLSIPFVKHLFQISLEIRHFWLLFQNDHLYNPLFVRYLQLRLLNIGEKAKNKTIYRKSHFSSLNKKRAPRAVSRSAKFFIFYFTCS